MPGGRPLKFKSVKELQQKIDASAKPFKTEKEFVDYLVLNIDKVINDFFGKQVEEVRVNTGLSFRPFSANKPRIDILVETTEGTLIGIECKNPKQAYNETSRAVSQLLAYAVLAEEAGRPLDVLALITTSQHNIGTKIIKKYKLPIRVFYVDRDKHGELGI